MEISRDSISTFRYPSTITLRTADPAPEALLCSGHVHHLDSDASFVEHYR
jgi:hypothetical protein